MKQLIFDSSFSLQLQMSFDSTNLATNGVPTQLLPSPLGASAYQRAFSTTGSPYQNALQAANPWLHQGPPQYIMQPQMIPANMDPNTAAALQYSPIMHQLSAQMSHLQLGGVSGAGVSEPHSLLSVSGLLTNLPESAFPCSTCLELHTLMEHKRCTRNS